MGFLIVVVLVGLACLAAGFAGGRLEPSERVIIREIEARHGAELDAAYDEGAQDERAVWLDVLGPAEASRLRPAYLAASAAEVRGAGLRPAEPADLARPDMGESPGPERHRDGDDKRVGPVAVRAPDADGVGEDAPDLRDPRELADTRAPQDAPWEPAAGDLILRQAGHHYDPSPGTAPGAGLSQSAATAGGPGEGTPASDLGRLITQLGGLSQSAATAGGPGEDTPASDLGRLITQLGGLPARPADLFDLLDDSAAFSMIRDEFTALRIETVAWRPVLPAWTERRAA